MDNFTPTTSETDMGVSEALLHAQRIIDAFSKALENDNCLQVIPIAMFAQADEYEALLTELSDDMKTSSNVSQDVDEVELGTTGSNTSKPDQVANSITSSVRRRMQDDCINCDLGELPSFDMDKVFGDIWGSVSKFIEDIKAFFDVDRPNFCQFTYMLSFVCIPDLIKILAIILAAILKLMSGLLLASFSILSFIMGIIGSIISSLLKFIVALVKYGLSPVGCLLEAIRSIVDNIPTTYNLKDQLTAEEFKLLGIEEDNPEDYSGVVSKLHNDVKSTGRGMTDSAKKTFEQAALVIESSAASLQSSIEDLLGVKDYLLCEPQRSGNNIVEKAEALFQLIMVSNLLMAMIENKSKATALDEICREQDSDYRSVNRKTKPFTTDDIASVIGDAFNSTTTIVESKDEDIAILLTPNEGPSANPRLSFFECSMNEFIKNAHMDPIINNAIQVAEDVLKGEGLDPRATKSPRTNIDDLVVADNQQVLIFGQNENSLDAEISRIIEEVLTFNTTDDVSFRRAISEKLESDTLPTEYQTPKRSSTITTNPTAEAKARLNARDPIDLNVSGFSGNITNKPIQLNCGTIDNLRDTLDLLKE
jgi:hypothetical protein